MPQYFKILGVMTQQIAKVIGIPAFIVNFFATIFTLIVIFMMVYMIFRFQPRS